MRLQYFLALLPLICVVYIGMYLKAAGIVARSSYNTLAVYQVNRVIRECIGAVLRRQGKYISFGMTMAWDEVFKLTPTTASYADIESASFKILAYMRKQRPWTYPESQRDAVLYLLAQALISVSRRQELESLTQQALKARKGWEQRARTTQHSHQQQQQPLHPPKPASNWRNVLGLSAAENEVSIIKKAYRSRAAKAHPDRGGSDAEMARLNAAFAEARDELSFV